jgi:S-DNA-T family DNA segregation ATPase FtsK/SpoIIIE
MALNLEKSLFNSHTECINIFNMQEQGTPSKFIRLFFLLLISFLSLSIYSYHPLDPGVGVVGAEGVRNIAGLLGAYVASLFFTLFGFASLFIPPFLVLGFILRLTGIPPAKIWAISLLYFISLIFLLSSLFRISSLESMYFLNRFPINCGVIGEFTFLLISVIGAPGLFLLIFTMFLVATYLGLKEIKILPKLTEVFSSKKKREELQIETLQHTQGKAEVTEIENTVKPKEENKKKTKPKKHDSLEGPKEFEEPKKLELPPPLSLLEDPKTISSKIRAEELKERALLLLAKLREFGIEGEVVHINPGPVITVFEFKPAPGIKLSKILSLVDDLALGLSAKSVRIVAPIPGKNVIGIEISNPQREWVYLKDILQSKSFQESASPLTIALGKDISGNPVCADLRKMPHLLIAGSTGSGKSIFLHCVILSLIYKSTPDNVRFLMIDPKRIELSVYEDIPYLIHPVVLEPKLATKALRWAVHEMERRYALFEEYSVRNLESFNEQFEEKLPYIVIIIDELADLMVVSSKEVETLLTRLAQMARAAGIHLLVATQRPSVDVITGLIKANFPARISFQVTSKVDSRTILDVQGAERLLGAGDMLFLPPGSSHLQRIHGPYVSEAEVKRVVEYLKKVEKPIYLADLSLAEDEKEEEAIINTGDEDDELYQEALKIAYQYGKISTSMLQRRLRIGYNRAARLVERMEREGIIGPSDGVRPRPVIAPPPRKPL